MNVTGESGQGLGFRLQAHPPFTSHLVRASLLPWAGGGRLPTEEEWEYAARVMWRNVQKNRIIYTASDELDSLRWYAGNWKQTTPRGRSAWRGNELGIHDMTAVMCRMVLHSFEKEGRACSICHRTGGTWFNRQRTSTVAPTCPLPHIIYPSKPSTAVQVSERYSVNSSTKLL